MLALPEVSPYATYQIVSASQLQRLNTRRVQVEDAAIEIEELHAIATPLDEVMA